MIIFVVHLQQQFPVNYKAVDVFCGLVEYVIQLLPWYVWQLWDIFDQFKNYNCFRTFEYLHSGRDGLHNQILFYGICLYDKIGYRADAAENGPVIQECARINHFSALHWNKGHALDQQLQLFEAVIIFYQ